METSIQSFLARTLVLIPAFNEEASLPGLLAEVRAQLPGAAVAVVDCPLPLRTATLLSCAMPCASWV